MSDQPTEPAQGEASTRPERRQFPRVSFRSRADMTSIPDGEAIDGSVLDIGLGGVRLVCSVPVVVGQVVSLTLSFTTDAGTEASEGPLLGRVISLAIDDDAAIVGVAFDRPLDDRSAPTLARTIAGLTDRL